MSNKTVLIKGASSGIFGNWTVFSKSAKHRLLSTLIIAVLALREGLYSIVKASLTGSIIGNALLILGLSMLAGGLKFRTQNFSGIGARTRSTTLTLAAVALVAPAAYHYLAGPGAAVAAATSS